jgi:hypothetical protein
MPLAGEDKGYQQTEGRTGALPAAGNSVSLTEGAVDEDHVDGGAQPLDDLHLQDDAVQLILQGDAVLQMLLRHKWGPIQHHSLPNPPALPRTKVNLGGQASPQKG